MRPAENTMVSRHTILLIDDDGDEHYLFKNELMKYDRNITCLTAYNCSEGYYLAQEKKPDVIFLDMNLPGTHGIACLRKFKKLSNLKSIPVYMYSGGSVSDKEILTALQEGARKWIRKPKLLEDYHLMFSSYLS